MANEDTRKASTVEVHFAQRLAANEKKIRDRAIKKLRKWLEVRSLAKKEKAFTEADLLKIWKGLHYGLWMQDKPLLQEEMSANISRLVHVFTLPETALLFVQVFLQTEAREWHGIDCWRIDKFMMLFRNILTQTLEYLKKRKWKKSLISNFTDILSCKILTEADEKVPDGLKIHLADIYIDELEAVGAEELTSQKILSFLEPFSLYIQKSKNWNIVQRVISRVFNAIIEQTVKDAMSAAEKQLEKEENSDAEGDEDDEDEDIPIRLQFDMKAISDRLFELGSSTDCLSRNRSHIYTLVKKFKDLDEGILPQEKGEEEEEADVLCKKDFRDAVRLLEKEQGKIKKNKKKKKNKQKKKDADVVGNSGDSAETEMTDEKDSGNSIDNDSGVDLISEDSSSKKGNKKKKGKVEKSVESSHKITSPKVNSSGEVNSSKVNSPKISEEEIILNSKESKVENFEMGKSPKIKNKKGEKVDTNDADIGINAEMTVSPKINTVTTPKSAGKTKRKSLAINNEEKQSGEVSVEPEQVLATPKLKTPRTDPASLTKLKNLRKKAGGVENEKAATPVLNMPKIIDSEATPSKKGRNKRKSSTSITELESVPEPVMSLTETPKLIVPKPDQVSGKKLKGKAESSGSEAAVTPTVNTPKVIGSEVSSSKKNNKRKSSANISELEPVTTPLSRSQKAKMAKLVDSVDGPAVSSQKSPGSSFAQFESLMKTPPAFVRKSISKLITPKTAPNKKITVEPPSSCQSDSKKKVIFNMKKNESLSFQDSIKFSPDVFNPTKNPDHGILKTPSPALTRSQAKKKQAALNLGKKRASTGGIRSRSKAADFF